MSVELVNEQNIEEFFERTSKLTQSEKSKIRIKYQCFKCKKEREVTYFSFDKNKPFCHKHKIEATAIEKYGSLDNMYDLAVENGKKTCLEKYGVENAFQLEKVKTQTRNRTQQDWKKRNEKSKKTF